MNKLNIKYVIFNEDIEVIGYIVVETFSV